MWIMWRLSIFQQCVSAARHVGECITLNSPWPLGVEKAALGEAGGLEEQPVWARCWREALYILSEKWVVIFVILLSRSVIVSSICLLLLLSHPNSSISKPFFCFCNNCFPFMVIPFLNRSNWFFTALASLGKSQSPEQDLDSGPCGLLCSSPISRTPLGSDVSVNFLSFLVQNNWINSEQFSERNLVKWGK